MTTLDTLLAVRALIERRENWCQRALQNGHAFCIRGAIIEVVGIEHESAILIALAHALPADFEPHDWPANRVVDYNNNHTHAEILALLDRAIVIERRKLGLIPDDKIAAQVRELVHAAVTSAQLPELVD